MDDGVKWSFPDVDFRADAETMLKKMEEDTLQKIDKEDLKPKPDSRARISKG